jgi:hypothetical protein
MQFVRSQDLKPGMRLAKPIYNKMGVLLYERNTKLTLQSINSIDNFGLIGIFILEPAEPVPPLSKEDLEFEQFQTIYMFKLKDCMDKLLAQKNIPAITELAQNIYTHYGALDHKLNFTQNLRSSADFVYNYGNYVNDGWINYLMDGPIPTNIPIPNRSRNRSRNPVRLCLYKKLKPFRSLPLQRGRTKDNSSSFVLLINYTY